MTDSPRRQSALRLAVAALGGAATTLAYAPFGLWPLAWLTPALLLLLLSRLTPRQGFATGFAWGFGWLATGLSWLHVSIDRFGGMPLPLSLLVLGLLIGYLALFPALVSYLLCRFFPTPATTGGNTALAAKAGPEQQQRIALRLLAFPPLWLGAEWLRAHLLTGFPWLRLGYSQSDSPLAPLAPVLGIEGIDLVMTSLAALLTGLWLCQRYRTGLLLGLLGLLIASSLLSLAHWTKPDISRQPLNVALVQGSVPQELKWARDQLLPTLRLYRELSEQAPEAELIIWPESAIPANEHQVGPFLAKYDQLLKARGQHLITGIIDYRPEQERYYNKMLSLGTGVADYAYGQTQGYDKFHLVPFGEFVPLESLLRPLGPLFNLPVASFARGERIQPNLAFGSLHLAGAICYEILLHEQVRDNFVAGQQSEQQPALSPTDAILTISNDAWFGNSIGPHQHLQIARMRAMELGRPVIRSTNNGITALMDARGNITARIPQFETEVLRGQISYMTGTTPFARFGTLPARLAALLMLLTTCALVWYQRRQTRMAQASAES